MSVSPSRIDGQPDIVPRTLIPTLALAGFVALLSTLMLGPLLPVISADLGVSVGLMGQVPALISLVAAGLGLVIGPVADRYGHRQALVLGELVLAASIVGVSLAFSYHLLLIAAVLMAAGRGAVQPVALAVAGARFGDDRRPQAIGRLMAGLSLAGIVGVPVTAWTADQFGWRLAFIALAALAALTAGAVWWVLEPGSTAVDGRQHLGGLLSTYVRVLQSRQTAGLLGVSTLGAAGVWGTWSYLGAFAVQEHGFSVQSVGLLYAATGCGVMCGNLATVNRIGPLSLMHLLIGARIMFGLLLAVVFAFPLVGVLSVVLIVLGSLALGFGSAALVSLLLSTTVAGRASTMTLHAATVGLGTAIGGSFGGIMIDLGGYRALALLPLVFGLGSAALLSWCASADRQPAIGQS